LKVGIRKVTDRHAQQPGVPKMRNIVTSFLKSDRGATAIEYTIIAAGIALVIIATVNGIGSTLNGTFTSVQSGLK
jgi:pilus assembly protein Flp/PilA